MPFLSSLSIYKASITLVRKQRLGSCEPVRHLCTSVIYRSYRSVFAEHMHLGKTLHRYSLYENFPDHARTLTGKCTFISSNINSPRDAGSCITREQYPCPQLHHHLSLEGTGCLSAFNWPKLARLNLPLLLSHVSEYSSLPTPPEQVPLYCYVCE